MKQYSFPSKAEMASQSKTVLKRKEKDIKSLTEAGGAWTRVAWENKMDYEVTWLGIPIIQNPYDIVLMQELIFELKPDIIVETGIAHGGSLIYYSSLLELIGKGKIIGIDVDIRQHNRVLIEKHPMMKRIELIEGSSVDPAIVKKVKSLIKKTDTVLVILDSDHRKPHVLAEMNMYADLVSIGSYVVVFDTTMRDLAGLKGATEHFRANSAMDAVEEFIAKNDNFIIDKSKNKYYVSSCRNGFIKKSE